MEVSFGVTLATVIGAAYVGTAQNSARRAMRAVALPPPYVNIPRYRISLVSPAYNEVKYIGNLVQSGWHQTEPLTEIVVADSSDPGEGTGETCQALGARTVGCQPGNISASRNAGALAAAGPDIIVFADADLIMTHKFVEKAINALEQGYALVHPRLTIYDSVFWNVALFGPSMMRPTTWCGGCVAVWADAFHEVGGYDEACNPLEPGSDCREDWGFGARIRARYGEGSMKLLGPLVSQSARRYLAQHSDGLKNFHVPIRAQYAARALTA